MKLKRIILCLLTAIASISAMAQGRLLYSGEYTCRPLYLADGQWQNLGYAFVSSFEIYENTLKVEGLSYQFTGYETANNVSCRRYGADNNLYYLVTGDGDVMRASIFTIEMPFFGSSTSYTLSFYDKGNLMAAYSSSNYSPGYSSPSTPSSSGSSGTRRKDCRVCYNTGNCQSCYGRGEVVNPYTNKWTYCDTCNKNYENNPRKKGKCYACSW